LGKIKAVRNNAFISIAFQAFVANMLAVLTVSHSLYIVLIRIHRGSTVLRNADIQPPHYTMQQARKPLILFSPRRENLKSRISFSLVSETKYSRALRRVWNFECRFTVASFTLMYHSVYYYYYYYYYLPIIFL
jgi:hypothetical protein